MNETLQKPGITKDVLTLGWLPEVVDFPLPIWSRNFHWLHVEHVAQSLCNQDYTCRRRLQVFDLGNVALGKLAERINGSFQCWHGSSQVLFALRSNDFCVGSQGLRLRRFVVHQGLLLLCLLLLCFHCHHHCRSLLGGSFQHRLQILQILLQESYLRCCISDLLQSHIIPPPGALDKLSLLLEHCNERIDEFQVGSGGYVKVPFQVGEELLRQIRSRGLSRDHDLHHSTDNLLGQFNCLQKLLRNSIEGLGGPLHEPINRATIDEGWKRSNTITKGRSNWRHRNDDVQVFATLIDIPGKDLIWPVLACSVGPLRTLLHDFHLVFILVQVGHLSSVEDRGHLFQESFVGNLCVREQEHHVLELRSCRHQQSLHVLMPLIESVSLGNLDLEELILHHKGCQRSRGFSTRTTNANKESISQRQVEHTDHSAHMLDERGEQNEVHPNLLSGIKLGQTLVNFLEEPTVILHLHVAGCLWIHKARENDWLHLHDLVILPLEMFVHLGLAFSKKPIVVLLRREPITEHPLILVKPTFHKIFHLWQRFSRALAHSLENFGYIPHVEGVVALRRRRQHVFQHERVDVECARDHTERRCSNILTHNRQKFANHCRENPVKRFVIKRGNKQKIEVPTEPVSDIVLARTRRAHRSQPVKVYKSLELPSFSIIPTE
mmetsp:Transcript_53739/g.123203  ORF Transcript_53739/g.123203 Transcript_53739/m.123203 type:complete len:663 (+) Transcript_53739:3938-5926(+)